MTTSFKVKDYPLLSEAQLTGQEQIFITATASSPQPFNVTLSTLQGYLVAPTGTVTNATNAGLTGQGLFLAKFGSLLEFRNVSPGSSKVAVALDSPNNAVTVDVVPSNIPINQLSGVLLSAQYGLVGITNGGTGATSASTALSNLGGMPIAGGIFTGNVNGVTPTELSYVAGATGNLQLQINSINIRNNPKEAARVISLVDVNISVPGTTIDGLLMNPGDSAVLNGQFNGAENGVYLWNGAASPMTRRADCSAGGGGEFGIENMTINIEEGTNDNTTWALATEPPIVINVTLLMYVKTSNNAYTASNGIILTGNNFTLDYLFFSGAFTVDSMGTATITASYVTNAMLAGSITSSKLVGTDIDTVGTISTGKWEGLPIASMYGGTNINTSASTGYPKITAGLWSVESASQLKIDLSLNNVENTALSTWPGTTNLTTLGTIVTGLWNASAIGSAYGGFGINTSAATGFPEVSSGTWSIKSAAQLKTDLSLNNVENTALSTWAGSTNLTTLGTIVTGVWNATNIALSKVGSGTQTGTGDIVLNNSPALITPSLGVATATTINKVTFTQPATGATLTLADGSVLNTVGAFTVNLNFTGGTSITFPTSGTVATLSGAENFINKTYNGMSVTTTTGTLTLANGSTLATSGAFGSTLTFTATTNVTFPTTGTLATLAGAEALTNKVSIDNGNGTVGSPSYTFTSGTSNGFYVSGTNKTGVSSNGVQVAEFNPTGMIVYNNVVMKRTATTKSGASTATGAELFGGIISMTGGGGVTLTLDTAANIYAAMGSPATVGASFHCFIVSTGGTNTTIATNTGLTLVLGSTTVNNDGRNYYFVVTNTATPTITVYGG